MFGALVMEIGREVEVAVRDEPDRPAQPAVLVSAGEPETDQPLERERRERVARRLRVDWNAEQEQARERRERVVALESAGVDGDVGRPRREPVLLEGRLDALDGETRARKRLAQLRERLLVVEPKHLPRAILSAMTARCFRLSMMRPPRGPVGVR